jgi:predicted MPP superfamily phosphohydrolase
VNEQEGDLVIFTGDLISYGTDFIEMSAAEFGQAKATYGAIAVVGDHDYWAGTEHVERAMEAASIPLLQNENRVIEIDSTISLLVTGITEVYSKRSNPEEADRLMRESDAHTVKIMASHQVAPYLVDKAIEYDYNLMLAGHTHGGQVRVPFMGMTFSASENETEYVSGVYWIDNLLISINNGLGFTLAPVRYNAKPTVSVIEVVEEAE